MRILLIAPDAPGINNIPEVRTITSQSQAYVLCGPVSTQDVYGACRGGAKFDILYFAGHGDEKSIMLSDGDTLSPEDVAQLARQAGTTLCFFSSCRSSRFASYVIRHGVRFAIYTNVDLPDRDAWKLPSAFFGILQESKGLGRSLDYIEAFKQADNGDGVYGFAMALEMESLLEPLISQSKTNAENIATLKKQITQLQRLIIAQYIIFTVVVALAYNWPH